MAPDVGARAPLLDRGTHNGENAGQGSADWPFKVVVWPTCGEASIQWRPAGYDPQPVGQDNDNLGRSVRRSRASLRRYLVHNQLAYMPTLTFRNAPESMRGVNLAMELFRNRLRYRGIDEPWLWVPEAGKLHGRLHVHYVCSWWATSGAVEVCQKCASGKLREVRAQLPPAESFCIGCLWGHGWVGAPSEGVGNARGVAGYVSKYVGKDLVGLVAPGANRYRLARGHQPEPEHSTVPLLHQAQQLVRDAAAGASVSMKALHAEIEGWKAPPTWVASW